MEKPAVPKFGSFKPKAPSATPAAEKEHRQSRSTSHSRDHKERHKRDKGRHEASHIDRYSDRDEYRYRKRKHDDSTKPPGRQRQRTPTPEPLAEDVGPSADLFMIDKRGDAKNVEYGGLHRYCIPPYRRLGYGRVLGAGRRAKIDRDASTDKYVILQSVRGERAERLLTKRNLGLAGMAGRKQRVVLPSASAGELEPLGVQVDFVSLGQPRKRKRRSESPPGSAQGVDYRSIEGKAKPDAGPDDSDLEFDPDSADESHGDDTLEAQVRARNAELSRIAKTASTNTEAWLALVEHQAKATFPDIDPINLTTSQRRSIADLRLSIMDQVFKHIPASNDGYELLLRVYIEEGSKIWQAPRLLQKWSDALKQAPNNLRLWQGYLDLLQTDHRTLRYETCKEAYLNCLATFRDNFDKARLDEQPTILRNVIYILLRYTRLVADAGYGEFAIATWQAVLEYFVLGRANKTSEGRQTNMKNFEEFWESDAPRLGEQGAHGWQNADNSSTRRASVGMTVPTELDSQIPYASFAQAEKRMLDDFQLPTAATDDEDDATDPFRYVMFSDLEPVLSRLPEQLRAEKELLIDAFLCFFQLPPVRQGNASAMEWWSDPFLPCEGSGASRSRRYDSFSLFFESPFRSSNYSVAASNFILRALPVIVSHLSRYEELGEYFLAYACQVDPAGTTKLAKRLLKARQTSLCYYNAYALATVSIAGEREGLAQARTIWTRALDLAKSLGGDARDEEILLWHSWVLTLLHCTRSGQVREEGVLRLLLAVPGGSVEDDTADNTLSAGSVLRARKHFEDAIDRLRLKGKPLFAALHAECLAWLLCLAPSSASSTVPGNSIDAALQLYSTFISSNPSLARNDSAGQEHLHQSRTRLITHHIDARRAYQPARFRALLRQSLDLFPENTIVLALYNDLGKQTRLDDRLRDAVSEKSFTPLGLWSWFFIIEAGIQRCGEGATKENVRALFKCVLLSANSDTALKSSLLLWRLWREFELERGDVDRLQRAQSVFFDGLRALPWSKAWVVEGMAGLGIGEQGLKAIYEAILERKLRMRLEVPE